MALVPIKLRPDPKARGWKPKAGWYMYDTCKLTAVALDKAYPTKTACWKAIADKRGVTVSEARFTSETC